MNIRGVQNSLIKKFTIYNFFLKYIIYKNYVEGFWQNISLLSWHLNNIT